MDFKKIVINTQDAIDSFSEYIPELDKKIFKKIDSLLRELSLESDGTIKVNIKNMGIIDKVRGELKSLVNDKDYLGNVEQLESDINDITDLQTTYFSGAFADFTEPKVLDKIQAQAFDDVVTNLTETGINENVVNYATDIVKEGVTSGASFTDLRDNLETALKGDDEVPSRLYSYTKQVVNDTLHGVARNYNALVTDDLGLEWYEYVGGLIKTSRDWCVAMEHKHFIHKSELAKACRGDINGKKVSLAGLMPDTTKDNVIYRCGGYNCEHHMVPVSSSVVPTRLRRKFEDVEPDDDEKAESRPRRR